MADEVKTVKAPVPVAIVAPDSMPVTVTNLPPEVVEAAVAVKEGKVERVQPQAILPSKPAETTFQQDLTAAGQRNINVKWEGTQQFIAISFALGAIGICAYLIVIGPLEMRMVAFTFLTTMAATINQNYFTRTNHTKIGGVSSTDTGR